MNRVFVCWGLLLGIATGCDDRSIGVTPKKAPKKTSRWAKQPGERETEVAVAPPAKKVKPAGDETPPLPRIRSQRNDDGSSLEPRTIGSETGAAKATQHVLDEVRDSVEYGPTLVVWLIDGTATSAVLRGQAATAAKTFYATRTAQPDQPERLLSVVVPYGERPGELPEPTADAAQIAAQFEQLTQLPGEREATFATLQAALAKYLPYRTQMQREVLLVIVSGERGDDWQNADASVALVKKHLIPVHVIGWPAPLGKVSVGDQAGVAYGPESRHGEMIEIESLGGNYDLDVLDSGFGPFALSWLAEASNGSFQAVRPVFYEGGLFGAAGSDWPTSRARQFAPQAMKKYAPDYVSEADYQAILKGNAACSALHNAAKLPRVEVRTQLGTRFAKRNEAQFARDLSKAQQGAARLEPDIERLYEALAAGEGDRAKLTSPRWQAEYDVAMGRACAAKARIEGYNTMLAQLKSGKTFANASSTTWMLEPAETTDAGSAILKLVERSQLYLKRVIADHPGTPWALIAERELQNQVGWKWTEE